MNLTILRPATAAEISAQRQQGPGRSSMVHALHGLLAAAGAGWHAIVETDEVAARRIMQSWGKQKKRPDCPPIEIKFVPGHTIIARLVEANVTNVTNVTNITTINKSDTSGKSWTDLTDKQRTAAFREAWLQHGGLAPKVAIELGISNAEALAISKTLRSAGVIG